MILSRSYFVTVDIIACVCVLCVAVLLLICHSRDHYCHHIPEFYALLTFDVCDILLDTVILFDYKTLLIINNIKLLIIFIFSVYDCEDSRWCSCFECIA